MLFSREEFAHKHGCWYVKFLILISFLLALVISLAMKFVGWNVFILFFSYSLLRFFFTFSEDILYFPRGRALAQW